MSVRADFKKGFYFFSTDLLDDVTMGSNPIKGRLEWSVDGGRGFFFMLPGESNKAHMVLKR